MGKTRKLLTSTPALALAAWMGYNIFVKDYAPHMPDNVEGIPNTFSAWNSLILIQSGAATGGTPQVISGKLQLLARIGITGQFPSTVTACQTVNGVKTCSEIPVIPTP